MLFSIDDPAAKRGKAVGIDLGTTNSLIAYVEGQRESLRCLKVDEGENSLPSAVAYLPSGIVTGRQARRLALEHPQEVLLSIKRFMGKSAADAELKKLSPWNFVPGESAVVRIQVGEKQVTPVEVSAELLRRLKSEAEKEIGAVSHAVITVPAYFDDAQRQATRDAGKLAGLEVLRLINEPTAAALAYGLDKRQEGTFAVYDLGGGTFDISILRLVDGVFEVKATGGDSALGGDDFDRAVAQTLLDQIGEKEPSPVLIRSAIDEAKAAKERLTDSESTELTLSDHSGKSHTLGLSRQDFEAIIRPILERTGATVRRALRDARESGPLDGVILVGGSTRSPLVKRYVAELFGLEPLGDIDPDEVVAQGAAIQANQLGGDEKAHDDVLLLDITPLSLGVETMGGIVEKIIPRNSTIPVAMQQTFTTYVDGQNALDVHVLQGERELAVDCRSLARFVLRGIPPLPAGMARIQITFQVDADGLLTVSAREELTGVAQSINVRPSHGLSEEEVERMLLDSLEYGEDDIANRLLLEARVDAQRILNASDKQLEDNGDLLTDEERGRIDAAMKALLEAGHGDDHRLIGQRVQELDKASVEFAQRIMDRGVQRALSGHSIDEFSESTKTTP